MGNLKNHPGMWLREDAAEALNALEDKYGAIRINSAGRTVQEQQELINRWMRGGPANRPPALYRPAMPATASNHVGGLAIDAYNYTDDRAKLAEFGFKWYGPTDKIHYTFTGWNGTPKPAESAPAQAAPATSVPQYHMGTVRDIATLPNTAGLQKIAKLYGYKGAIDNIFGAGSQAGLQTFLNKNYGGSLPQWLRRKWGYVGNDNWGPQMAAAATRADTANWQQLK